MEEQKVEVANKKNPYQNGKIYKITNTAQTKCYIGSTCNKLSKRFSDHKSHYLVWKKDKTKSRTTSYELFDEFGVGNCQIILIESYACKSRDELNAKEAEHIKNVDCVNKFIPCRTDQQYYQDNKDTIKAKVNKYREQNKDAINAKKSTHFDCPCGRKYAAGHKSRHERTTIHKNYLEVLNDN
jgi:hypothetical protein